CEACPKKREANEARTRTPFKCAGLRRHTAVTQVPDQVLTPTGAAAVQVRHVIDADVVEGQLAPGQYATQGYLDLLRDQLTQKMPHKKPFTAVFSVDGQSLCMNKRRQFPMPMIHPKLITPPRVASPLVRVTRSFAFSFVYWHHLLLKHPIRPSTCAVTPGTPSDQRNLREIRPQRYQAVKGRP